MVECRGLYRLLRSGSDALVAHEIFLFIVFFFFFFVSEKIWMESYQ